MKKVFNGICVVLGFVFLGIGAIGIVLPVLPMTPFLLLAALFFAKGSKRFHVWFLNTKLYRKYLDHVIKNKEMTAKSKAKVLMMVTGLLIIGFILSPVWYAKAIILIVLIGHYYYFLARIKTMKENKDVIISQE